MQVKRRLTLRLWVQLRLIIMLLVLHLPWTPVAAQWQRDRAPDLGERYMSPDIAWYEAHWQGMDVLLLTTELARKLEYPKGLQGIFVDEVTLNAAYSGLLAGDIIIAVDDHPVTTLKAFQQVTMRLKTQEQAAITVLRKIKQPQAGSSLRRMVFVLRANPELGFAQVESAPMIKPGEMMPHPYRGPCTRCHAIGEGFQLPIDPDLITLPPPIISQKDVDKVPPHQDYGRCQVCHQVINQ